MISKSTQLVSTHSTVNKELQGIHIGGSSYYMRWQCVRYV